MIINKINKSYQTRSDMPNTNWLGHEWYLIPDNSELAAKIITLYPRYDFVLNSKKELIDVIEIPKTDIELIQEQITEIDGELIQIDKQGVTRHMENIIDACNLSNQLYDTTKNLINKKRELRIKRQELVEKL